MISFGLHPNWARECNPCFHNEEAQTQRGLISHPTAQLVGSGVWIQTQTSPDPKFILLTGTVSFNLSFSVGHGERGDHQVGSRELHNTAELTITSPRTGHLEKIKRIP